MAILEAVRSTFSACVLCPVGVLGAAEQSANVYSLPSFTLGAGWIGRLPSRLCIWWLRGSSSMTFPSHSGVQLHAAQWL